MTTTSLTSLIIPIKNAMMNSTPMILPKFEPNPSFYTNTNTNAEPYASSITSDIPNIILISTTSIMPMLIQIPMSFQITTSNTIAIANYDLDTKTNSTPNANIKITKGRCHQKAKHC